MNAQHQNTKIVSFLYLKIFIVAIVLLILGSISVKIYSELRNSSFKSNSFSVLYLGKETYLLNVDKKGKRFTFIKLGNINGKLKGKNTLEMSLIIGAPVNAVIQDKRSQQTFGNSNDVLTLSHEIELLTGADGISLKRMNAYDVYKFMNVARSAKKENVHNETIKNLQQTGIDQILSDLLRDSVVHESSLTVEVINETGINGLANVFSQMLSNGGFNVIEVRSSGADEASQIHYNKPQNDVVDSLFSITSFEEKTPNVSSVADISIFLGNDLPGRLSELYN